MCSSPTETVLGGFLLELPWLHDPEELLVPDDNELTDIIEFGRCTLLVVGSPEPEVIRELRNLGAEMGL